MDPERKIEKLKKSLKNNVQGTEVNTALVKLVPGEDKFEPTNTALSIEKVCKRYNIEGDYKYIFRKTRRNRHRKFQRDEIDNIKGYLAVVQRLLEIGVKVDVEKIKDIIQKASLKHQMIGQFIIANDGRVFGRVAHSYQSNEDRDFRALGYAVAAEKLCKQDFKPITSIPKERYFRAIFPMEIIRLVDPSMAEELQSKKWNDECPGRLVA